MYYNIDDALSYNCLFTFVVGGRGVGKSYSAKKRVIKNFLNGGKEFVLLRRYKAEQRDSSKYFDDIAHEFPEHEITYSRGTFYIDGKKFGHLMILSTQAIKKSVPYPNVSLIIFEEFLIDSKSLYRYLRSEVETFLEAYMTVSRDRDVRCLFLANNVSMYNPYFSYFKLYLKNDASKCRRGDVILLRVTDEEFEQHMANTRIGKVLASTAYGAYAIENKSLRDTTSFIEKRAQDSTFLFTFYSDGDPYGVWESDATGLLYVSKDIDPFCKHKYVFSVADHEPNMMLLRTIKSEPNWRYSTLTFKAGNMRFADGDSKAAWLNIMRMVSEVKL